MDVKLSIMTKQDRFQHARPTFIPALLICMQASNSFFQMNYGKTLSCFGRLFISIDPELCTNRKSSVLATLVSNDTKPVLLLIYLWVAIVLVVSLHSSTRPKHFGARHWREPRCFGRVAGDRCRHLRMSQNKPQLKIA